MRFYLWRGQTQISNGGAEINESQDYTRLFRMQAKKLRYNQKQGRTAFGQTWNEQGSARFCRGNLLFTRKPSKEVMGGGRIRKKTEEK